VDNEDNQGQFRGIEISPNGGLTGVPVAIVTNDATSISASATKIAFKNRVVDTHGWFDVTYNTYYPHRPGYYFVTVSGLYIESTSVPYLITYIRVNGSTVTQMTNIGSAYAYISGQVNTIVYLNGTTNYLEIYCSCDTTRTIASGARLCINFLTGG